ncbi:MAG: SPL family radical SAM protein [Myxococcaceae bacterium]
MQAHSGTHEEQTRPGEQRHARYSERRVRSLLRQDSDGAERWHWSLDPYEGCELGCVSCRARLDRKDFAAWRSFETEVGVKTNAVEALLRDLREPGLEGRELVLGSSTDPWQPVEEHFRVTRAILTALCELDGLTVRANTRSSLVARDTDLFKQLSAKGRVIVSMSICSLDEGISRLLEPHAQVAFRRLAAVEALSRGGVDVAVVISPVLPGLTESELELRGLLSRAANAGARFAGISMAQLDHPSRRALLLRHLASAYPEQAGRLKRIVGRRPHSNAERSALLEAFDGHCKALGLEPLPSAMPRTRPPPSEPSQLGLFGPPDLH